MRQFVSQKRLVCVSSVSCLFHGRDTLVGRGQRGTSLRKQITHVRLAFSYLFTDVPLIS